MQLLVVFTRVGSYIRVPGVDVDRFAESMRAGGGGLLGTIDQLSGGSISRFGLFSLGAAWTQMDSRCQGRGHVRSCAHRMARRCKRCSSTYSFDLLGLQRAPSSVSMFASP